MSFGVRIARQVGNGFDFSFERCAGLLNECIGEWCPFDNRFCARGTKRRRTDAEQRHAADDPRRAPAAEVGPFWYAEDYHQQYLHKNPGGYCNHGPNGMTCPVGIANLPAQQEIRPPSA